MAEEPQRPTSVTHLTIINYVVVALIGFQSLVLHWTLNAMETMQKAAESERKQLLDHALKAATLAEKTDRIIESTKSDIGAVRKEVGAVKKAVETIEQ